MRWLGAPHEMLRSKPFVPHFARGEGTVLRDACVPPCTSLRTCNVLGLPLVLRIARTVMSKYHRPRLTHQQYDHSPFWCSESKIQVLVGLFILRAESERALPACPSACRQLSSPSRLTSCALCECLCVQTSPFQQDTRHIGPEPIPNLVLPSFPPFRL